MTKRGEKYHPHLKMNGEKLQKRYQVSFTILWKRSVRGDDKKYFPKTRKVFPQTAVASSF